MIEIIKPGTKKKIECEECGAILRYEQEDVQIRTALGMISPVSTRSKKYIVCPQCNYKIVLEATR